MHYLTIFALAAVATSAAASVIATDIVARPAYQTSYGVSDKITGDQKSAVEVRDGDVTKGSYSLVQPDGVLRTVNYISTPLGGFQAQVINNGVAGHPAIIGVGKGVGAVAAPGLAVGNLGLGLGARSVVGGLGLATPLGLGLATPLGLGLATPLGLGLSNSLGLGLGQLGLLG